MRILDYSKLWQILCRLWLHAILWNWIDAFPTNLQLRLWAYESRVSWWKLLREVLVTQWRFNLFEGKHDKAIYDKFKYNSKNHNSMHYIQSIRRSLNLHSCQIAYFYLLICWVSCKKNWKIDLLSISSYYLLIWWTRQGAIHLNISKNWDL